MCGDANKITTKLASYSWVSLWILPKIIDSILRGIGQVCFGNNPLSGLLILIGLFLGDYNAGIGAVLCSLVAICTAKVAKIPDGAITSGLTNFSAVLVGTVMAALYPVFFHQDLSLYIWGYMILAAVFSVFISQGLGALLSAHNLIPFTLPFNVATSITFLCLQGRGFMATPPPAPSLTDEGLINNASTAEDMSSADIIRWDQVFLGSLLGVGQVYAVESVACSILTLIGLFLCSPVLTLVSYLGSLISSFTALLVTSPPYSMVYAGVWGYNGLLSAGALSFFMVPLPRVFFILVANVIFTTFLQAALVPVFSVNHLPVFTVPFCLSSLLFLGMATALMPHLRVGQPTVPEIHLALHFHEGESESGDEKEEREDLATKSA